MKEKKPVSLGLGKKAIKPLVCRREINENIRKIYAGEELTRSLKTLNCDCEFRKEYDKFCLVQEGKPIDEQIKRREYQREYAQKPEVKARKREYQREYQQKPEVKARIKEYKREYAQKPEVKARNREYQREYRQKPEVKARKREYWQKPEVKARVREYLQKPEVKAKAREYQRKKLHIPKSRWRVK